MKQAEVSGAAGQLRNLIRNNDELSAQSRRLSAALIGPFADIFKRRDITHLIVVPDHITAAIPYAALDYDGRFLLESFSLSIAPALELTQSDRAKAGKARALYAGVSLPVFNLPFIAIDLIVSNILLAMGMMMVSPMTISLPFKLLLFVLVDGWHLVVRSLVQSFGA